MEPAAGAEAEHANCAAELGMQTNQLLEQLTAAQTALGASEVKVTELEQQLARLKEKHKRSTALVLDLQAESQLSRAQTARSRAEAARAKLLKDQEETQARSKLLDSYRSPTKV